MSGQVRLAKQPHYRDRTIIDKRHPRLPGFTNVRVCSDTAKGKTVSPMYLGPVTDHAETDGASQLLPPAVRFENFWQSLKVFTFELSSDTILPRYFERRAKNFVDPVGHRRVFPKKLLLDRQAKVEFTYYGGCRYSWVEARKAVYCPMYAELVQRTPYFKELKERLAQGENLLILGFDGFTFDPAVDNAVQHLEDETKSVGHEFVICCLLAGLTPWM